jgi:hypothetical protein
VAAAALTDHGPAQKATAAPAGVGPETVDAVALAVDLVN